VVGRFAYATVPPPYRMWIWPEHLAEAMALLGLQQV
jgi:hypothetical protein